MSLTLKVNFLKGWPSPAVVEKVGEYSGIAADGSAPSGACASIVLDEGMVGKLDQNGKWQLGMANNLLDQQPFIFRNGVTDPDGLRGSPSDVPWAINLKYGGIQGIALQNPLIIETAQYVTTGSPTYTPNATVLAANGVHNDANGNLGKVYPAATNDLVIGIVVRAPYTRNNVSYLTFSTDVRARLHA